MSAARKAGKAEPESIEQPLSLEEALAQAAAGDPPPELRISLRVGGGVPSQRYRFELTADGSGRVGCQMGCELSEREGRAQPRLEPSEVASLAKAVLASRVLEAPSEPPRLLPDSLVGVLEIAYGDARRRWIFAADREQAETQGATPAASVARAADALYSLGGRLMGRRSVKP